MRSVKCSECGFVGWADAERCKKCGAERTDEPTSSAYQEPRSYANYQPAYRGSANGDLKKGMAVTSLVLGILGFFTFGVVGLGSIIGVTLAIVAMNKAKREPHVYGGSGVATAGLVTNILCMVMIVPVGIIAAIAIPNLLASRRAANEGASIATLRRIHSAEATYQATQGAGSFGTLDELAAEGLINSELASRAHYGYRFNVTTTPNSSGEPARFQLVAVPLEYGQTGIRSFYIDESGVIRGENNHGAEATELSPPLNFDTYSPSSAPPRRVSRDGY